MSYLARRVVPSVVWYALLVAAALAADFGLHRLRLFWVGRYLGIAGSILILLGFIYSLRKRNIIRFGSPKALLDAHEFLSWAGALMILVHAGVHFNALLPWIALAMMLVVVASGFTGRVLLKAARESLRQKQDALARAQADKNVRPTQGPEQRELERKIFLDSLTVDLMQRWRAFHFPVTTMFAVLAVVHIVSILMFWQW